MSNIYGQISSNAISEYKRDLFHALQRESQTVSAKVKLKSRFITEAGIYYVQLRIRNQFVSFSVDHTINHAGMVSPDDLIRRRLLAEHSTSSIAQIFVVLNEESRLFLGQNHWRSLDAVARKSPQANSPSSPINIYCHLDYSEYDSHFNRDWECVAGIWFSGALEGLRRPFDEGIGTATEIHGVRIPPWPDLGHAYARVARKAMIKDSLRVTAADNLVRGIVRILGEQQEMVLL